MSDVIYYNISINSANPDTAGKTKGPFAQPTVAEVTALNNIPILQDPSEYVASIIRFSVPCFAVPLVSFIVQTEQSNINLGIGSFTLQYNGVYSNQTYHIFKPQIEDAKLPKPPLITQDFSTYYYFLYNYSWLMGIYNTALQTAFTDLQSKVGGALNSAKVPYFYFDPNTQLINLYADAAFFDQSLPNPVYINFNSISSQWFNGMPFNEKSVGSLNGADNYFIITNTNGINQKTINGTTYDVLTQEFISLAYLSPLKNITISTNMNVISEQTFLQSKGLVQNLVYNNIITDFLPDLSGGTEAGTGSKIFIYNASSLYRVFEFVDKKPLYVVNLAINWLDQLGNTYPLLLVKGTQATIKLMFIKKKVFQNFVNSGSQVLPYGKTYNVNYNI